jgi:outer membrane protein OmpA-like peptidoglycan-associated protein
MRKLVTVIVVLASCATTEPPKPVAHPRLCGRCVSPCPNTTALCELDEEEVAAASAPAPAVVVAASFDPGPGVYGDPQRVTLSTSTPNAVIHYTADGSTPTPASPVYAKPIPVASSTKIRAIAIAPGMAASQVSDASYTIAARAPQERAPVRVAIAKGKLELKEKVFFDTARTTIEPASFSLLDEVAAVLKDNPGVERVVIEGHADSQGPAAGNRKLSQGRAEAVRAYLIERGVEPGRLRAAGFGSSRPIADNSTAAGRELNRRVEFVLASP